MNPVRLDRRTVLAAIVGGTILGGWLATDDRLVVNQSEVHTVRGTEVYSGVENGGEVRAGPGDEVHL